MKQIALIFIALMPFSKSFGDMFGGDTAELAQILQISLQQLTELQGILDNQSNTLGLLQDVNRGINDSLSMLHTISPNLDLKPFKGLRTSEDVLNQVRNIYGSVVASPEAVVQNNSDTAVAEAIGLNNSIYEYTKEIDQIGEDIKSYSHSVSPAGAAKLTAESMGVVIHVMNEQLRAQATGLKLQAQQAAVQNKKEKDQTKEYLNQAETLSLAMKRPLKFEMVRF